MAQRQELFKYANEWAITHEQSWRLSIWMLLFHEDHATSSAVLNCFAPFVADRWSSTLKSYWKKKKNKSKHLLWGCANACPCLSPWICWCCPSRGRWKVISRKSIFFNLALVYGRKIILQHGLHKNTGPGKFIHAMKSYSLQILLALHVGIE